MCGIVGYLGAQDAVSVLLNGLKRLEYRGYDSAGVAFLNEGALKVHKKVGRIAVLEEHLATFAPQTRIGIGHTRWATHGRPSDQNAHPHFDCTGKFAVVHNGIIENYGELRERLERRGHRFSSETDTEVLAHLVEEAYAGDLGAALREALKQVRGSYAVVLLSEYHPDRLVAARKDSPLVVGLGRGEYFLASDIPALLPYTRQVYLLSEGEMAELTPDGVRITDARGEVVTKEVFHVDWDAGAAERGGFPHFMLKEICEQPRALRDTLGSRITPEGDDVVLKEIGLTEEEIRNFSKITIVACGTAYHAGLVGKYVLEKLARIPVEVDLASEFRYRDPLLDDRTLVVVISQSGETADTLAALREARARGCRVLAVTNVVGSTVAREADEVIYTWAGPEIAVASTKAYTTQVLVMYLLGLLFAKARGTRTASEIAGITAALRKLPEQVEMILDQKEHLKELAEKYCQREDVFFIGRGLDYAVALEGALKLKEISYIHAEAYAAGELKHGTLALIVEGVPVVALATQNDVLEKLLSNVKEVKAREGTVLGVCLGCNEEVARTVDHVINLPEADSFVAPILAVVPLQLLAYYMAAARGCDIDKPRNLAKSVTVE
ncbi:MAG: glutamine--fructose-6-phosphate transaminase (isomerizing) [Bacillota bacterium]|nr:glutamine--fructose-6-phosphate transaminase (isomerizing) [Bacillota bacterium]